jgi:hypothetical protein
MAPFLARAVELLHDAGVLVAGPSWGSGDYDHLAWSTLAGAGPKGWCGLDAIAVHAYWSAELGPTRWNAWRWQTLDPAAVAGGRPVFVTECGIAPVRDGDANVNAGMIGEDGWKSSKISRGTFLAQIGRFVAGLRAGELACLYTCGATDDWRNHDADELVEELVGAGVGVGDQVTVLPSRGSQRGSEVPGVGAPLLPGAGPSPTPDTQHLTPAIGEGFRKAEGLIGPFVAGEVRTRPGLTGEVSQVVTPKGWGVWDRATNEVVVYVAEGAQVWRDRGGHELVRC